MSAPVIPNLNTFRRGRGGTRGGFPSRITIADKDAIVRSTDNDASSSRMSAVETGYLDDPFAEYLCDDTWQRRLPLMNRGTYIRTTAIDKIVDTFLSTTGSRRQIISLGAGSDTRYFRLKREKKHLNLLYHELDFKQNNDAKISRLKNPHCVQLIQQLCDVDMEKAEIKEGELRSTEYSIHSVDLRNLPSDQEWVDTSIPTLLISECCLIYLPPDQAARVLSYFAEKLASVPLAIVIYEPFRPHDPFGRTMIRNLTTRGIVLQTIEKYSDIEQQSQRLTELAFNANVVDTNFVWHNWVNQDEKDRIDKLEWMDEVEEFELLAKHYCVGWGWKGFHVDTSWQAIPAFT